MKSSYQNQSVLFFKSSSAFTPFRLQQKLLQVQKFFDESIHSLTADYWFLVKTNDEWNSKQHLAALKNLLPQSILVQQNDDHYNHSDNNIEVIEFWVIPRLGTISPWSSKAIDILTNCLFSGVDRIERAIHYRLKRKLLTAAQTSFNTSITLSHLSHCCYDPLTESVVFEQEDLVKPFEQNTPQPLKTIPLLSKGIDALLQANQQMGLALDEQEINYLRSLYQHLRRDPTDVELMMFAQVNSEHCRHKIFNASWKIDHVDYEQSLFSMVRHTHQQHPHQALVAYHDNAAVLRGQVAERFFPEPKTGEYSFHEEETPFVLKVETHNHPTAISPFPGAATGSGGEIRDEAATGRGAYPKAGLCGFAVSHLLIPDFHQPWEIDFPQTILASPLSIMLQGPIGAAAFNNEFGRPNLTGFFRTFAYEQEGKNLKEQWGYHKPIMIAGGIGNIRPDHIHKRELFKGCSLIVLGGPAMAIGLGGGAASSKISGDHSIELDFASVQRANPEMQRRCQEVINSCWALGDNNPILSIHDVGAGGLSNAMPELVAACHRGAKLELRRIPNAESGMTPLEIWCNEAQERFVLAVSPECLSQFETIAKRERCPFAVLGVVTDTKQLELHDDHFNDYSVNLSIDALFEKMPRKHCQDNAIPAQSKPFNTGSIELTEAVKRVLQFPCVSSKNFLITIGDRSVTGLVARDQMVGPWQIPVADVAVTNADYKNYVGEAMAMGERPPVALLNSEAAARLAVGEALTNLAAADLSDLSTVSLSANWMAAASHPGEGAKLYAAVKAICLALCPELGIAIPVGKDSLSMQASWQTAASSFSESSDKKLASTQRVTAPLSLIITAAAPVQDVRQTLTPLLDRQTDSILLLIDLGLGQHRLGGSVLAQAYKQLGDETPDLDDVALFKNFFKSLKLLKQQRLILAYHDRADGGLLATLCEMMFASHCGLTVNLPPDIAEQREKVLAFLFNEELGAVIQIQKSQYETVLDCFNHFGLSEMVSPIAVLNLSDEFILQATITNSKEQKENILFQESRVVLQRYWTETSYRLQTLRDHPDCAKQEFDTILDAKDPGLNVKLTFNVEDNTLSAAYLNLQARPKVAILREQGVNGYREMAAAFDLAGFLSVDVHMSDLLEGKIKLSSFNGLAAGGGFSFGDVLGAGRGWAQSILCHAAVRQEFIDFFQRQDTFTLGACNGCQMLAELKSLIPNAECWPTFAPNFSQQFEARLVLVRIEKSPSIFFTGMEGSILPVVVAHGEGQASFENTKDRLQIDQQQLVSLRYVDHYHRITENYPFNPNGSSKGITGVTNLDGRVMIVMPHPERVFRTVQFSWHPANWPAESPWLKMFQNARRWLA